MKEFSANTSRWSVLLLIAGLITLFFAQSAFWINHSVFNQQNFTSTVTNTLQSDQSRQAISSSVVNKIFEERPIAKKLVGARTESLINGLLASDLSTQVFNAIAKNIYTYTTTPDREDIAIELSGIKEPIIRLLSIAQTNSKINNIDINRIPEQVVLVESSEFPDLSGTVKTMLWLGPVLWLATLGFFATYIFISSQMRAKRTYIVGTGIVSVCLLSLFVSPYIPPSLSATLSNVDSRLLVESLAAAFLSSFETQMFVSILITAALIIVFNRRFNIAKAFDTLFKSLSKHN